MGRNLRILWNIVIIVAVLVVLLVVLVKTGVTDRMAAPVRRVCSCGGEFDLDGEFPDPI